MISIFKKTIAPLAVTSTLVLVGQPVFGQATPGQAAPGQEAPGQVTPGQVTPAQGHNGVPAGQVAPGQGAQPQGAAGQGAGRQFRPPQLSDQQITEHVRSELANDPGVVQGDVTIAASEGVVTLSGSVDSILAKERAVKLAEAVKGVQVVVDELEVQPSPPRSDDAVRQDVLAALAADPATQSYAVRVEVNQGVATLEGEVGSWSERSLAETVAKSVQGVRGVADHITVDYTAARTDAEIAADIQSQLKWNVYVKNWPALDVQVNNGEVTITGMVDSAAERSVARSLAYVAGVRSVDVTGVQVRDWTQEVPNVVQRPPGVEPSPVETAVKSAMMRDPRVNSNDVNVQVQPDGSTVLLTGTVYSLAAKLAAEQDARNALGVANVVNRIIVRTAGEPTNNDITHAIRTAFMRDPYVRSSDVRVVTVDGTVTLTGAVHNYFEKAHAGQVAARTVGVSAVYNQLQVDWSVPLYVYNPYVDDYYMAGYTPVGVKTAGPTRGDSEIEESIKTELFWTPFVRANDVNVSVKNGVATLTGTVSSWTEKAAAGQNAIEGGAVSVANNIIVSPGGAQGEAVSRAGRTGGAIER